MLDSTRARPRPAYPGAVGRGRSGELSVQQYLALQLLLPPAPLDPPSTAETNDGLQTYILGEGGKEQVWWRGRTEGDGWQKKLE